MKRLALVLLLSGCFFGGDPDMTGTWNGSVTDNSFTLTLTEKDHTITGSGRFAFPGGSLGGNVIGTHFHPVVTLTLSLSDLETFDFEGSFETKDLIRGVFNPGSPTREIEISFLRIRDGQPNQNYSCGFLPDTVGRSSEIDNHNLHCWLTISNCQVHQVCVERG